MAWMFPVAGENEWSGGSWMPNTTNHRGRTHAAIDVYAKEGTAIISPTGGTVMAVGVNTSIGGNWVQIRGNDGIVYYFAHMQHPTNLQKGQVVEAGSFVGAVGRTGSARNTKPHLHFSMKYNGKAVDPRKWFKDGEAANPDNYQFEYMDPRGQMANDPYFNPQEAKKAKDTQLRSNIMQMLDTMSNAVAGGRRGPMGPGEEMDEYVESPTEAP